MATADSTPLKNIDIKRLHDTIEIMDNCSQAGFSEIASIAKLCLNALETPFFYRNHETIADVLNVICDKAEEMQNCINSKAEEVGCNYIDKHAERRYLARRSAEEVRHV